MASLRWNHGVHNFMIYGTGDIPVGTYDPSNLANLGIGHGAADGGVGYTYFNPATGHEFSAVTGVDLQSQEHRRRTIRTASTGISTGAPRSFCRSSSSSARSATSISSSPPDSGPVAASWATSNRACIGVGPQIGFLFPVGDMQGYLNLKGYYEFAAENRPQDGTPG